MTATWRKKGPHESDDPEVLPPNSLILFSLLPDELCAQFWFHYLLPTQPPWPLDAEASLSLTTSLYPWILPNLSVHQLPYLSYPQALIPVVLLPNEFCSALQAPSLPSGPS